MNIKFKKLNKTIIKCKKCPRLVKFVKKISTEKRKQNIGENYWGKGYAMEACENLIEYFFSNTSNNLIHASHMTDNIKSKKIIVKLGFKFVKAGKKFSISRNEIIDNLNYELLKP